MNKVGDRKKTKELRDKINKEGINVLKTSEIGFLPLVKNLTKLEKKEEALKTLQLSEIKPTSRSASVSPRRSARGSILSRLNPFSRHGGKRKMAKKQRKTRKSKKSKRATRKH